MFCNNCGAQNDDNNYTCVNCGAPLGASQQPTYQQPAYQQPAYQQPLYANGGRPAASGPKPTVLYMIAGAMAALLILFIFLPQFTYQYSKLVGSTKTYNVFGVKSFVDDCAKYSASNSKDVKTAGNALAGAAIGMFLPPVGLCVAWAILSFMRKRAAGILGVIGSAYYAFMAMIWMVMIAALSSATDSSKYIDKVDMTAVPVFMLLIAIAGIPISIIQIVKKKYL